MGSHEGKDHRFISPTQVKEQDFAPQSFLPATPPHAENQPPESDTTATNSSDEFDWDDGDEIKGDVADVTKAKRIRWLWSLFMKLSRFVRVLLIGILGAAILIAPLLVVNLRFRNNPARLQVHIWSLWFTIIWSAACATTLVVHAIPHIVLFVIRLFGKSVERLRSRVELTMAVSAWIKLVLDVAWAWIALSVIRAIYHPPQKYWVIINRVMQAMFAASMVLLVEKLFLHFVAINFHEKALADRLDENRLGLKALDRLSHASAIPARKSPMARRGHRSPGSSASLDALAAMDRTHSHDSSQDISPITSEKKSSPTDTKMHKRAQRSNRQKKKKAITSVIVDQVGGAIGQVAFKNTDRGAISGLYSAKKLARKLFSTLKYTYPPRSYLTVEDFEHYFRTTAEAHAAFAIFDKDENGDLSKREMREAIQRIYRERKALTASLKDLSSIVAKLDAVLISVALMFIIFICLLIFNRSNTLASLVPLATIILGFSFIFGNSAQTLFESLIFIFSTHVFDVGDLVMIDEQFLTVKEFGLFSTTFRRVDGQEIIAPNALLANSKLVHNLRRSKAMWESTMLTVAYDTPIETFEELRSKIESFINTNSRDWSGFMLNIDKMDFQNALHLSVAIEHRRSWQDWAGRWARRTLFMRELKTILEELEIGYTMPIQPVLLPGPPTNIPRSSPVESYEGSVNSELGNAGGYQAGDMGQAPGKSFHSGVPSFG
ncbi:hypothetical protein Agabi119p4_1811 [Agaricus bisporus var. burnettii]|uniref:EF-hand domain-containing protein n=1 Tax=Agaricus bisporus var. burnettii TaxID=192524 RepID=A0A8H7F7W3_AGABI|nr:hypothetical protein Agabi119p4_1811 [Agaricus bisporus var. burnettii]